MARAPHASGEVQLDATEKGLREVHRELREGEFEFVETDEDIHTAVERRLAEFRPAAVLLKPFPIETLIRLIDRVLAQEPEPRGEPSSDQMPDEEGPPPVRGPTWSARSHG